MPSHSIYIAAMQGVEAEDAWAVHSEARKRWRAGEKDLIVLSVGDHDFTTDERIVDSAVSSLRAGHHHYTPSIGLVPLREKIAAFHSKRVGEPVGPENVAVVPGAQCGVFTAGLAVLDPGDHVIAFDPMYVTYYGALIARGATLSQVPLHPENDFLPDMEEVRAALRPETRAMVINSPNNPTGAVWPKETMEVIADFCREHDLWLISDEVYCTMTYEQPHHCPRLIEGMKDRTMSVYSFSKSHAMTGWRLGWVVADPKSIEAIEMVMGSMLFGSPPFVQEAAMTALDAAEDTVDSIRELYRHRRDRVCEGLAAVPKIKLRKPDAGMFLMLDIRETGWNAIDFAWKLLEEQKVSLLPGEGFGKMLEGHLRLSYGASDETLDEAARRLSAFIQKHG
ncbi:pyridoxal phosphate-dependent aminotransferase [Nisaea acidiphila]|uniref:Aminotransferase n=1 Tax=Nisaea acidiphila TaxID=1862145 RepID=A0A9J7B003_9PROT|nr:pyridoxal phosphate-dependent aminotransferase [Nisaea acidiphila]UUX51820.1 pyridoxal phosphate-dependent aminotransferase [Nisaea acidiphila]